MAAFTFWILKITQSVSNQFHSLQGNAISAEQFPLVMSKLIFFGGFFVLEKAYRLTEC